MKLISTILLSAMSITAIAQDKTLDINYFASYGNSVSFRWSSRLAESQDWKLRAFTAGGLYNVSGGKNKLSIIYDVWRGCELGADVSSKYGLNYSTQGKSSSMNFTLYKIDGTHGQDGLSGRIDINMKFGGG